MKIYYIIGSLERIDPREFVVLVTVWSLFLPHSRIMVVQIGNYITCFDNWKYIPGKGVHD